MVCHRQSRRRKRQGTERLAADQQVIARSPHRAGVCVHRTQVPCDRTGRRGGQQRFPQDHGGRRRRDDPRGGQRPVYSKGGSYDRGAGRRDRRRYRQRLDPDVRDSAKRSGRSSKDTLFCRTSAWFRTTRRLTSRSVIWPTWPGWASTPS